jgi:hypothetical protein
MSSWALTTLRLPLEGQKFVASTSRSVACFVGPRLFVPHRGRAAVVETGPRCARWIQTPDASISEEALQPCG